MTPIVATMLVGTGVSIAGQLLSAGAKHIAQAGVGAASFASALDDARSRVSSTSSTRSALEVSLTDRLGRPGLAADAARAINSAALGAASYRRMEGIAVG